MHKNKWAHSYLRSGISTPLNVTLDCRITDRDSVSFLSGMAWEKQRQLMTQDFIDGGEVVGALHFDIRISILDGMGPDVSKTELEDIYTTAYNAAIRTSQTLDK